MKENKEISQTKVVKTARIAEKPVKQKSFFSKVTLPVVDKENFIQ
jgi:hypothetical protein